MSDKKLDLDNPQTWKTMNSETLHRLLDKGIVIKSAWPDVYFVVKAVRIPHGQQAGNA